MRIGFKTAQINVGWALLAETWEAAASLPVFTSAWLLDHLSPPSGDGSCLEGWTALALLAHHVPDKRVGHLVVANPFRSPALLAKMATTMDVGTGGRFVLALGAGDYAWEAEAYGTPFGSIAQRLRDLEASLQVIRALFGPEASRWPASGGRLSAEIGGITLQAGPYRLSHARNDPPPLTPGGPPIWVGALGERVALRIVAQHADGWNFSGADAPLFVAKRDILLRHCEALGRDPMSLTLAAQIWAGSTKPEHEQARQLGTELARAGCQELILRMPPAAGPEGLRTLASEVAEPLAAIA